MDFIRIPATVLRQKDKELYLFKMSSALLREITFVTPRSEENPDELQRVYNESRAKEIGAWIKEENSLLPNAIVVDFKDEVEIEPTADPDVVTITIPDPSTADNPKIAYILDGQHRVKGFEFSDGVEFDLAVIGIHNVSDNVRGKIFIDINSKQVKVDERLLLDLMAGTKSLAQDDDRVYLGLSPGVKQTVKALLTVRWNCIVPRKSFIARWAPDGEAAAGSAGAHPAKE